MPSSCLALPNGDTIGPTVWGKWTSSVHNYAAKAEEVLTA